MKELESAVEPLDEEHQPALTKQLGLLAVEFHEQPPLFGRNTKSQIGPWLADLILAGARFGRVRVDRDDRPQTFLERDLAEARRNPSASFSARPAFCAGRTNASIVS